MKDRIQEREDKLCGVCYDEEATCKLNCLYKSCSHCFPMTDTCPFCRKSYICKCLWKIDKEEEFENIDEQWDVYVRNYELYRDLISRIQSRIERANNQAEILKCCAKINELVGTHVFYREAINNKTTLKIHEHARVWIFSNLTMLFYDESFERIQVIQNHVITVFSILSGIISTYNQE